MSSVLINNIILSGKYNNYSIAGNITNAFAIGDIGSTDDFFLVGAEPLEESNYPLLTGNILDSEGKLLFRLINNVITFNPGHCSKILGNFIGYEIHDSNNELIFKVETLFQRVEKLDEEFFVTTIKANFYNKDSELVFFANSGESSEMLEIKTKYILGFSGGFGMVCAYTEEEVEFIRYILSSRGKINQPIRGMVENQAITLDGKAVQNAIIRNCEVTINNGDFVFLGKNAIQDCSIKFSENAEKIIYMYRQIGSK